MLLPSFVLKDVFFFETLPPPPLLLSKRERERERAFVGVGVGVGVVLSTKAKNGDLQCMQSV